ncbi:hypothetical protein Acr_01g0009410 [Actinidia rufa]|uniref:Uncharacterized protein n=1 Tax=Actinidia rufa TaxID=165716 RepID=A0A7J0E4C8_9ERIC|nr:hypothetical protein Acr_01g0009410 [Actinidia rufa]
MAKVAFYETSFPASLRSGLESGWLYFKARPGRNILKGPPAMSRDERRDSSSRETTGVPSEHSSRRRGRMSSEVMERSRQAMQQGARPVRNRGQEILASL